MNTILMRLPWSYITLNPRATNFAELKILHVGLSNKILSKFSKIIIIFYNLLFLQHKIKIKRSKNLVFYLSDIAIPASLY